MKKWTSLAYLALSSVVFLGQSQAGYEKNNLIVDETSGAVKVRLHEKWRSPTVGLEMDMPTIASTGTNGKIKISQQATVISVAANTTVEILEGSVPGLPMQRIIQDRGSAFYDIAPRGDNKLRVEAAYLVAVVKGTQFNVSADADSTTIALFEGHLQIEAPSVGDTVDIYTGQIAKFHRGDLRISILDMDSGELVARSDTAAGSGSGSGESAEHSGSNNDGSTLTGSTADSDVGAGVDASLADTDDINASLGITTGAESVGIIADGSVSLESTKLQTSQSSSVDLAKLGIVNNVAADIGLGDGTIDLGVVDDTASVEVDAGLDLGLADGSATVDVDTGLDLGVVDDTASVDVDAGLDLGLADGSATVDVDTGLDLGVVDDTASVDVDVGLDLGLTDDTATVDVDTGLDLGVVDDTASVDVNAGLDLGLTDDTASVDVDTGLDLGVVDDTASVDVEAGLDLGLVDGSATVDVDTGLDLGVVDDTASVVVEAGLDLGLVDDVGNSLTDTIDTVLDNLDAETGSTDADVDDVAPKLDDLVPDLGGLLGR